MTHVKYSLGKENKIYADNVCISSDRLVELLNDYEEKTQIDNQLISAYEDKIKWQQNLHNISEKTVKELQDQLKHLQKEKLHCNVNYWKGVEKAQKTLLDEYLMKITELEKQNSLLEYENDTLKERCKVDADSNL